MFIEAASDKKFERSLDQNIDILTIDINTVSMFWSKVRIYFESIYWPCLLLHQMINIFGKKFSGIFQCKTKKPKNIVIQIELPSIPISSLWVALWDRYTSFYFAMEEPIWLNYVAMG